MRITAACALLLIAASALANPSGRLTVLVPINPGVLAGANGTVWHTTLYASNRGDNLVTLDCSSFFDPRPPCPSVPPHSTVAITDIPYSDLKHPGFFQGPLIGLFATTSATPDQVSFSLRVTDSITAPLSAGTEIPLPRPTDFHNATMSLAQVPVNVNKRVRIRLYGLTNGSATVRVVGIESGNELLKTTVDLSGVDTSAPVVPTEIQPIRFPSYAELALPDVFSPATDQGARVEITPNGNLKLWAFASATDNASQQFTIIAPSTFEYVPISLL